MKKKILAGLGLVSVLGGGLFLMTACGNETEVKALSEKLDNCISSVEKNEFFESKTYSISGVNYQFYAPKYMSSLNNDIKTSSELALNTNIYVEQSSASYSVKTYFTEPEILGVNYDLAFGYAFNSIKRNSAIIKNNYDSIKNTKSSTATTLIESLSNFEQATSTQSREISRTNKYLESIGGYTSSVANNAIYNYKKEYQNYVRTTINLANQLTQAIDELCPMVYYSEENKSQMGEDTIFNFSKLYIKKGEKASIEEIVGKETKTYTLRYTDKNKLVWQFSIEEDYKDAKAGDTISLKEDLSVNVEFKGHKVIKGSKAKVVEISGEKYFVAQFTDNNNCTWTKVYSTDSKSITGTIELNKEITVNEEALFDFDAKRIEKGSIITKIGAEEGELQSVQYIDELGYVWIAEVHQDLIEVVPATEISEQFNKLKDNVLFDFSGYNVEKGSPVDVLTDDESVVDLEYINQEGYMWKVNTSKDKLTSDEKSYFEELALDTLSEYFNVVIEKMDSKRYTETEINEMANNVFLSDTVKWMNNYNEFMKKATYKQVKRFAKKYTSEDIQDMADKYAVFKINSDANKNTLSKINFSDIRFHNDWNLTDNEMIEYAKLQNYNNDLLPTWVKYYTTKL